MERNKNIIDFAVINGLNLNHISDNFGQVIEETEKNPLWTRIWNNEVCVILGDYICFKGDLQEFLTFDREIKLNKILK